MTIKHIVFCGGGPTALISYGVFKHLHDTNYLNIDNIESFYGTSSGAILSTMLILNLSFDVLDDYIVKRPWDKVFNLNNNNNNNNENYDIISYLSHKGIDGKIFIINFLEPLMTSKNIDIDITLLDFYKLTKKKLYVYGCEINLNKYIKNMEISYETFPEMKLIDALAITSAVPFVFKPLIYKNMCFVDGGLINNFPINNCLERNKETEIISVKHNSNTPNLIVKEDTDFIDYIKTLLKKTNNTLSIKNYKNKNIISCETKLTTNIDKWFECLINNNIKIELIKQGEENAKVYLSDINYEVVDSINSIK
jgi:predicted acylesterase/phospholipase RssA